MGWRGAIRTLGTLARAAERDARLRAREHARQLAAMEKIEAKEKAAEAVREFEDFLQSLVSAHRTCSNTINWQERATASPPPRPQRTSEREDSAERALVTYSPSLLSRLLGRAKRKRAVLEEALVTSRAADDARFAEKQRAYEKLLAEYEDERELAERILAKDGEAMLEVTKILNPFSLARELGDSFNISVSLDGKVSVELAGC